MAATTWHSDLSSALSERVNNDIVVARDAHDQTKEYAAMSKASVMEAMTASNDIMYEVVTDGECFLHFVTRVPMTEALWMELGQAIVDALPDVPAIKGMTPMASLTGSDNSVRIVFSDIVLSSVHDNFRIAQAVSQRMEKDAGEFPNALGCLAHDVYEIGFCQPLNSARGEAATTDDGDV